MAAAPGGSKQAQQPARAARLEEDRLEAPVGRIGAGVDLEAEAEVGEVREEDLCRQTASAARAPSRSDVPPSRDESDAPPAASARSPWRRSAELSALYVARASA